MSEGDPPAKVSPLIVLGMHRGGTSAFAGILHALGVSLGSNLMPAAKDINTKGFWEHVDVHCINERLYAALGRSRFDPREMPENWRDLPAFATAVSDARLLIERDFAPTDPWAIKDPRLCRTLPVWLQAMDELDYRPCVVLVARHPHDVALSLQAQRWVDSPARSHVCWLQHMVEAERWTRTFPRAVIRYDALIDDWRTELARAGTALGVAWSDAGPVREARIDAFIDAGDRHFDASNRPAENALRLPSLVAGMWSALTDDSDTRWRDVAAVADMYSRGAEVFAPCLDEAIVEASIARHQVDARDGPTSLGRDDRNRTQPYMVDLRAALVRVQQELGHLVESLSNTSDIANAGTGDAPTMPPPSFAGGDGERKSASEPTALTPPGS